MSGYAAIFRGMGLEFYVRFGCVAVVSAEMQEAAWIPISALAGDPTTEVQPILRPSGEPRWLKMDEKQRLRDELVALRDANADGASVGVIEQALELVNYAPGRADVAVVPSPPT